ncbi:MAG: hypothetical protein M0D57_18165 [Sphingobacteriales bacterium JAD_PAG50586_3]|nr:MAG: hypothetical protein M0D57_18165 [Sphingobacteriales bacterium JAD_PAG50586_3]
MKTIIITAIAALFALNANAQQPTKPNKTEPVKKNQADTTRINNMPMDKNPARTDTLKNPWISDSTRKNKDGMPPKE